MRLITHARSDPDAVFSVCAAWEFIPDAHNAPIIFVPSDWNGEIKEGDLVLDVDADGRGWKGAKGPNGTVRSCFAMIVERYASPADQAILTPLVAFIDEVDAHGFFPVMKRLTAGMSAEDRAIFMATNLISIFYSFKEAKPDDDRAIIWYMSVFFSGFLKRGRVYQKENAEALEKVARAELFGNGTVAILHDHRQSQAAVILFQRGVRVIVYVDGYNLGVVRADGVELCMDHLDLRAVVDGRGRKNR